MDEKKREVTMSDAEIERILKDPNTWAWDGCTYPEGDHYSDAFKKRREARLEQMRAMLKSA